MFKGKTRDMINGRLDITEKKKKRKNLKTEGESILNETQRVGKKGIKVINRSTVINGQRVMGKL